MAKKKAKSLQDLFDDLRDLHEQEEVILAQIEDEVMELEDNEDYCDDDYDFDSEREDD
jgi:hypothetical protein|tara:strand:- start:259 stop:432 length:174 start_codon:yes stop_codon:yes gene_type:complete